MSDQSPVLILLMSATDSEVFKIDCFFKKMNEEPETKRSINIFLNIILNPNS